MSRSSRVAMATVGTLIVWGGACQQKTESASLGGTATAAFQKQQLANFAPLPSAVASPADPASAARVSLGRQLYYETVLSDAHDLSCNGCHPLNGYGADGRRVSLGHRGQPGNRNAPTVYNAAGHVAQFWDGRAPDVEAQAKGPILNPAEMGMPDSAAVLAHLRASAAYRAAFNAAFPRESQPITYDNVGKAIGTFERGLLTPARWDKYLRGDSAALTADERQGFATFVAVGCQNCHNGAYVGGNSFQKVGMTRPWPSQADSGRFAVTKSASDVMVFKVPSLRNVAQTGPYFHDGSVASLDSAVKMMARHQLGREITDRDAHAIATWLGSLTGEIPLSYIGMPPVQTRN